MPDPTPGWWARRKAAKCERVGHATRRRLFRGYVKPERGAFRIVAVAAGKIVTDCRRCRTVLDEKVERYYGIHDLTLNSDAMDALDREGEVWHEA